MSESFGLTVDLVAIGHGSNPLSKSDVIQSIVRQAVHLDPDLVISRSQNRFEIIRVQLTPATTDAVINSLNLIQDGLRSKDAKLSVAPGNQVAYLWHDDIEFEAFRIDQTDGVFSIRPLFEGHIDKEKISEFEPELFQRMDHVVAKLSPPNEDLLSQVRSDHRANFVFVKSLLDYQSIGRSGSLEQSILDIYRKSPYLFEPSNDFWLQMPKNRSLLGISLLRLSGMFRRPFNSDIKNWMAMIEFLRTSCASDAANFFDVMCAKLGLDANDSLALEKMQIILERGKYLPFPYSVKNGRFMLTVMTENRRGHGLLRNVKREHLTCFNLPVDSQVIRVTLNTGLVKLTKVHSEPITHGTGKKKKEGVGLEIMRSDFTEPCQRAWRMVSEKVGLLPAEIDFYVWSDGSLLCKRYGEFCFICPFACICDTWATKLVRESRGAEWYNGSFSFCRPQTGVDRLIIRDDNTANAAQKYHVKIYSDQKEFLDITALP